MKVDVSGNALALDDINRNSVEGGRIVLPAAVAALPASIDFSAVAVVAERICSERDYHDRLPSRWLPAGSFQGALARGK